MALLHHHGVFFAGSDNVKNWDKEALFGCQVGKERAIIDALHERDLAFQKTRKQTSQIRERCIYLLPFFTATQLRVDPDEHWQASCARIGVFYGKSEVDDEEMDENEMDEEMQSVIAQVEKKVDSILVCITLSDTLLFTQLTLVPPYSHQGEPSFLDVGGCPRVQRLGITRDSIH